MRWIGAHGASRSLPRLIREAEAGERFVITRRGEPVATLGSYRRPEAGSARAEMTPEERTAAIERATEIMRGGSPRGTGRPPTRG